MGTTVPGVPPDPDEAAGGAEPEQPASHEDAAGELELEVDGPDVFRDLCTDAFDVRPRTGPMTIIDSGDAVHGAVVEEALALSPPGTRPSTLDFDEYYLTHHDRLLAAVRRYCAGDHALAEDVVQETFLKAYQHWEEFVTRLNPYAWLRTVATRVAQDIFRHERLRTDREQVQEQLRRRVDDEWEGRAWLISLRQLPPQEAKVMWYVYVLRYPRKETAEEINRSLSFVDKHIKQALDRLRRELDLEGED